MMKKQTLEDILTIGIFLPLFVPLIGMNSLYFPFITGKAFAFRILIEILGSLWMLLAIFDKKYRPRFSWILISIIVFVGIVGVADFFGVNAYRSFWSSFERMDGLINILHMLMYFLVLGTVIITNKIWDRFMNTTIGVSAAVSLLALAQLVGSIQTHTYGNRLDSTIENAAFLGVYLLLHIFLAIFMLVRWKGGPKGRYIYGSIILLHAIILYFTGTRSSMLGLIVGMFVFTFLILIFGRDNQLLRKIAIGIAVCMVMLVGVFFFVKDTSFVKQNPILNRFTAISLNGAQNQARPHLWRMAIQGFKERPILGWGQENFTYIFYKYYHPALYSDEPIFDRAHNVILDWLVAGGIVGVIGYLTIFGTGLWYLWYSKKANWSIEEKSILTGFLAGYFFNELFLFDNITSYIIFFSFLAYVHAHVAAEYSVDEKMHAAQKEKMRQGVDAQIKYYIIPAAFVALLAVYVLNVRAIQAAVLVSEAVSLRDYEPMRSFVLTKEALSYQSFGRERLRQEAAVMAIVILGDQKINNGIKQQYFNLVRDEMKEQVKETPPNAYDFYLLGALLHSHGDYDEALNYLQTARELSPKNQLLLLKMRDVYMAKKDYDKAYDITKYTYELDPRFNVARNTYLLSAILKGDTETESKLLVEKFGTDTPFDPIILQTYADAGRYDKIIEIYKKRLVDKPDDTQTRVSLSVAYVTVGNRHAAIKTLEEAIKADPSLKNIGERWISDIQAGKTPQ